MGKLAGSVNTLLGYAITLYIGVGVVRVGVSKDAVPATSAVAVVVVVVVVVFVDVDDDNVDFNGVGSVTAHGDDGVYVSGTGEMSGGEMVLWTGLKPPLVLRNKIFDKWIASL